MDKIKEMEQGIEVPKREEIDAAKLLSFEVPSIEEDSDSDEEDDNEVVVEEGGNDDDNNDDKDDNLDSENRGLGSGGNGGDHKGNGDDTHTASEKAIPDPSAYEISPAELREPSDFQGKDATEGQEGKKRVPQNLVPIS